MKNEVTAIATATVSNVACGFDIMGFAIDKPEDKVKIKITKNPGIQIKKILGDNGRLSLDIRKNTLGVAVQSLANYLNFKDGLELELYKQMPLSSGLGSSAASAVAGVFALNELLGTPLCKEDLLNFALDGEKITSGGVLHADNVAPSLFGGFVVVRSTNPLDVIRIPTPKNLFCTVVHPHIEIITSKARKILSKQVPLKDAVVQWGNVAGLIAGLMKSDFDLISRSLEDVIIEPQRSTLIPGYYDVKNSALNAGALGVNITGSGPSIFALSTSNKLAKNIGISMKKVFKRNGIRSDIYISTINHEGPRIV
jgi:homoserine kinase